MEAKQAQNDVESVETRAEVGEPIEGRAMELKRVPKERGATQPGQANAADAHCGEQRDAANTLAGASADEA